MYNHLNLANKESNAKMFLLFILSVTKWPTKPQYYYVVSEFYSSWCKKSLKLGYFSWTDHLCQDNFLRFKSSTLVVARNSGSLFIIIRHFSPVQLEETLNQQKFLSWWNVTTPREEFTISSLFTLHFAGDLWTHGNCGNCLDLMVCNLWSQALNTTHNEILDNSGYTGPLVTDLSTRLQQFSFGYHFVLQFIIFNKELLRKNILFPHGYWSIPLLPHVLIHLVYHPTNLQVE